MDGDIAATMIDGIDRFLMKETERSVEGRERFWKRDFSSREAYEKSIEPNRRRLAHILGVRDERPARVEMELVATTERGALVGKSDAFEAYAVRWRAFGNVHGEGLLLKPVGREPVADVVAIPDADQTPEMICGLAEGVAPESQYARRLAESGCRVVVPVLISRKIAKRPAPGRQNGPEMSDREFLYRSAYELGRHIIGYEIQKVLAAVDWFKQQKADAKVGVAGYGEGGMLALYSGAIDTRIAGTLVSGYIGKREDLWRQPMDRNVFGLLERFGDAEVMLMVAPRRLIIESSRGPEFVMDRKGGAPGVLTHPAGHQEEIQRAIRLKGDFKQREGIVFVADKPERHDVGMNWAVTFFRRVLVSDDKNAPVEGKVETLGVIDGAARYARQFHELDRHNQELIAKSADVRRQFMSKLDTSSVAKYEASAKPYREMFERDVLGKFEQELLPPNPRTRKVYDTDKYAGYEVVLDVFPDVIAYGVLLLPKDLRENEKRPVVVCQHGLEGRPKDTIEGDNNYYHAFAAKLCERGFITFAPQNLYIFGDRFRQFSRKANPLGKTIWSIIVPQHRQILNWLKTLPNVDPKRIGFYGLSYGGKTAMRVPAVLEDYCLSICSGDFNEWVLKNASTSAPFSYMFTHEYEIFEWDLGSTFNYAEMAALIAPRPFMVERGHFDTVSTDEYVAFEFAKVRRLYQGMLKLPADRCQIEFFDGPHTIHGVGTFEFLHKHLQWETK
jgi:dienelactone hydrolase